MGTEEKKWIYDLKYPTEGCILLSERNVTNKPERKARMNHTVPFRAGNKINSYVT